MNQSMDLLLAKAREEGYQKGLYDGLRAAHQNSNGRTPSPDSPAGKRIVAQALLVDGIVVSAAVDETYDPALFEFVQERRRAAERQMIEALADYEEDYAILEGPTVQDEAVGRFNALLKNADWEAVDYDTAVGYLESNDFDPWTAYLEFGRDNPDWHEEALTAAQRNI